MGWIQKWYRRKRDFLAMRRQRRLRRSVLECLEARCVMNADDWHNVLQPLNVSGDSAQNVSPIDALLVINEINSRQVSDNRTGLIGPAENVAHTYMDVSCDAHVTPFDALMVINAINSGLSNSPTWQSPPQPSGTDSTAGRVVSSSCSPKLIEGSSISTHVARKLVLPDSSSGIEVTFETPDFDTTQPNKLRDAFEIVVLDQAGQALTLPFRSQATAAFNWSESLPPQSSPNVQFEAAQSGTRATVTFNLHGTAANSSVTVLMRLINNDGDTSSNVIIRSVDIVDEPSAAMAGQVPDDNPLATSQRPSTLAAIERLTDVSNSLGPIYATNTLVDHDGSLLSDLRLENVSPNVIHGPILVAIEQLSDDTVFVVRPDGMLPDGRPYLIFYDTNEWPWLTSGGTSESRRLQFSNPNRVAFTYKLTALASFNRPPLAFDSQPLTDIAAGRLYETVLTTSDPDDQPLTYSLVEHPETMSIDAQSGRILWSTTPQDIGNHRVTVRATDPFALSIDTTFAVHVLADLPNRPPVFTGFPNTSATTAGSFEITTLPGGAGTAAVTSVGQGDHVRVVTANAGTSDLSVIQGTSMMQVSLGQPPLPEQVFQSGLNVDLGLPPITHYFDKQQIDWLTEGDFNGDGNVDLASTLYALDGTTGPQIRTRWLSISLGNGDGTFTSPVKYPIRTTFNDSDDDNRPVTSLLAQDFDDDGQLDLLATTQSNGSSTQNALLFWKGLGNGQFALFRSQDPGMALQKIDAADVNGDGKLDLIATVSSVDRVGLLLGQGDGTFGPYSEILNTPGASYWAPLSLVDVDGINGIDVVLTSANQRRLLVLGNDGSGHFEVVTNLHVPDDPFGVFAADFDNDQHIDLLVLARSGTEGGGMYLYRGTADPKQYLPPIEAGIGQPVSPINLALSLRQVDFNNDGYLDVCFGHFEGTSGITVALNRGDGRFQLETYQNASPSSANSNNDTHELIIVPNDVNRDGLIDLISTTNWRGNGQVLVGATVLLATQPGQFSAPRRQKYATTGGIAPFTGINYAADFNNDGNVDLLGVVFQNGMRISFGNGDGTFQASVPASTAVGNEFYTSGFHADFNRDGFEDALWLGTGGVQGGPGGRVLVGFNDGNAAFSIATYSNPQGDYGYLSSVVAGDFNQDGFIDFAGRGDGFIDIWLYSGSNSFARSTRLSVPAGDHSNVLNVADFDGDGRADVVTASGRTNERSYSLLTTYLGRGDGTFTQLASMPIYQTNSDVYLPRWSDAGDVNNDGHVDLAISNSYSRSAIFLGRGGGTFSSPTEFISGASFASTRNIYLRDLNDDRQLDMVQVDDNQRHNVLRIRFGAGDGTFSAEESYILAGGVPYVDFADVNKDGALDAIAGTSAGGFDSSTILLGRVPTVSQVVSADINHDTQVDLVALSRDLSRVTLLTGNGIDNYQRQPDIMVGLHPVAIAVADLDNNGRQDIITANESGRSLTVLAAALDGTFDRRDIPFGQRLSDVGVAQLNSDSLPDLVVLSADAQALFVLTGSTAGYSSPHVKALGDRAERLALGDVTGDGLIDAVLTLPHSKRLMILPGDGLGHWFAPQFVSISSTPGAIALADLNADGSRDILVTLPEDNQVAMFLARSQGRFGAAQKLRVGDRPDSLQVVDWNTDGRIDFLVGNHGDDSVSLVINRFDPSQVYAWTAQADDPDGDPITYELLQSPDGMLIDATTGQIVWAPSVDQTGKHSVTLRVSDNRDASATLNFEILVAAPNNNHAPIIFSQPSLSLSADQVFNYALASQDADGDSLRYRLVDGPTAAVLNATTGQLTWDPRADALQANSWPFHKGGVTFPYTPQLATPSITLEGFFKLDDVARSHTFYRKYSYMPYPFTIDTLELRYLAGGTLRVALSDGSRNDYQYATWLPEADRWYHLAVTFDDSTRKMQLLVDGQVLLAQQLDHGLQYDGVEMQLGAGYNESLMGAVTNFRIWNYARTAEQLKQDWSRNLAEHTPGLLLDYRFDSQDAQTIRDHSQYGHHGRRFADSGPNPRIVDGLAPVQYQDFTIQVEDGHGGTARQAFRINVVPVITGSVTGTIFEDLNQDGQPGAPEPGLPSWTLYLDQNYNGSLDTDEPRTVSSNTGAYRLDRVVEGSYTLRALNKAGFQMVVPQVIHIDSADTTTWSVPVKRRPTANVNQISGRVTWHDPAGLNMPAQAGWIIFSDLNQNKWHDGDEPSTTTDYQGNFLLSDLQPGEHTIAVATEAGWTTTGPASQNWSLQLSGNLTDINFDVQGTAEAVARPRWQTDRTLTTTTIARDNGRWIRHAIDPNQRPLTYRLLVSPDGMAIDAHSGTVAWTPTLSQVGTHQVIVQATNDQGAMAIDEWPISVLAPNSSPVISSAAPNLAFVGRRLTYAAIAQDAEDKLLAFELVGAPPAATIDVRTGLFQWVPSAADVGHHLFTIQVTDPQGKRAAQIVSLEVQMNQSNFAPTIASQLRQEILVGQEYRVAILASDVDGDALSYSLANGPSGATISSSGVLSWTPNANQMGAQNFLLQVMDSQGAISSLEVTIQVVSTLRNSAPQIRSQADRIAIIDQMYDYDVHTGDADHDAIFYELVRGPAGMSLDSARGKIRWVPVTDQLGQQEFVVRALDAYGAADEQRVSVSVRRQSGPPIITSVPPTTAYVGQTYLMSLEALDLEGDPLEYRLLNYPDRMTIDAETGQVVWTPSAANIGQYVVLAEVRDTAGGSATQAFVLVVLAGIPNLAPIITSPIQPAAVANTLLTWQATAADPEGQNIVYSLRRAPAGMSMDDVTGIIRWTPNSSQVGRSVVTLAATDDQGGIGIQSFEIETIAANYLPQFISSPIFEVFVRDEYRYATRVTDINLDPIQYDLVEGPTGMTIDGLGQVHWATNLTDLGVHSVKLRASDPRGGSSEQAFAVRVIPDTIQPRLSVVPAALVVRANSPEVFEQFQIPPVYPSTFVRISASDNVGITELKVTANGLPMALDTQGLAHFRFEDWGFTTITVVAQAQDAAGNVTTTSKAFAFVPFGDDPAITEFAQPAAVITSPNVGESVHGFVDIVGSAMSNNFASYKLSYRRADSTEFKTIINSSTAVDQGLLGRWDTTLLENDEYILRLEQEDQIFGTTIFESSVGVSGDFKLGNFRLSFVDMTIDVGGIPVTIARSYDTLRSDRNGDFGFGWRMEFREADLRTSLPKSGLEDLGLYTPFKVGTRVFVTLPGSERQGFTFTPEIRPLPGFGQDNNLVLAVPHFTPDPGVKTKLSVSSGALMVNSTGQMFAAGGIPWNPGSPDFGGYTLTTPDGTRFSINGDGLMTSVTDLDNNTLILLESGIRSSSGASITFTRDRSGRISSIIDPSGKAVRYQYSGAGDLSSVTDRLGNETTFHYQSPSNSQLNRPHYLDKVVDPLGRNGVRVNYDANGRLVGVLNADGHGPTISYDPINSLMTTRDALGNATVSEYDANGMLVASTDALGGVTRLFYDAGSNLTSTIDPLGRVSRYEYDAEGRQTSFTDAQGNTSRNVFDARGNSVGSIDPLGRTTRTTFDAANHTTSIVSPGGAETIATYRPDGRETSATNGQAFHIEMSYSLGGQVTESRDWNGLRIGSTYDANGLVTGRSTTWATSTGSQSADESTAYDAEGRVIAQTDALGAKTQFRYDALGQLIAIIDPLGRATTLTYDQVGRQISSTDPIGFTTLTQYDAAGRVVTSTDALGRTTKYVYDALGRVTMTIMPDATATDDDNPRTRTEFDEAGQVTATIDPLGRRTEFTYDLAGRLIATRLADGGVVQTVYDAAGQVIAEIDALGRRTETEYDLDGKPVKVIFADGTSTSFSTDTQGLTHTSIDETGQTTVYSYIAGNQLASITDALGGVTTYTYDQRGKRLTQTDANGHTTRFEYDLVGRETARILPGQQRWETAYDSLGRAIKTLDPNGNEITYEYDQAGRLAKKLLPGGHSTEYAYNAVGKLVRVIDARGTKSYEYDLLDRLVRTTEPDGQTMTYSYDMAGQQTSRTTSAGTVRFEYDAMGRMIRVTDPQHQVTEASYDLAGQRTRTQYPNGVIEDRSYDVRGNLVRILASGPNGTLTDYRYTYDTTGRIVRAEEPNRTVLTSYDAAHRLLSEVIVTSATERSIVYTYDSVGNRLSLVDSVDGTTTYSFDINDRLVSSTRNGVTTAYTYDANGNRVTATNGSSSSIYQWNAENQLIVASVDGINEAYRYDAFGNRVAIINSLGIERRMLLDVSRSLAEVIDEYTPAHDVISSSVDGFGPISRRSNGVTEYVLSDRMGSTRMVVDASGVPIGTAAYSASGQLLTSTGTLNPLAGYTGEPRSNITGWDYLRARYYDPATGVFTSADPFSGLIKRPASLHKYRYADSDPANKTDPSGLLPGSLSELLSSLQVQATNMAVPVYNFLKAKSTLENGISLIQFLAFMATLETAFSALEREGLEDHANVTTKTAAEREFKPLLWGKIGKIGLGINSSKGTATAALKVSGEKMKQSSQISQSLDVSIEYDILQLKFKSLSIGIGQTFTLVESRLLDKEKGPRIFSLSFIGSIAAGIKSGNSGLQMDWPAKGSLELYVMPGFKWTYEIMPGLVSDIFSGIIARAKQDAYLE